MISNGKVSCQNNGRKWINPYLPDRKREGDDSLEDLLSLITQTIIHRLEEIEEEIDFDRLTSIEDVQISYEAKLLKQKIHDIKIILRNL